MAKINISRLGKGTIRIPLEESSKRIYLGQLEPSSISNIIGTKKEQ